MAIIELQITDFRNFSSVELNPSATGLNIISGANGSGKTSLLEAIYYLGLGRSFRHTHTSGLIKHQTSKFSLFARIKDTNDILIPLGVEKTLNGGARWRLAEQDLSNMAELAYLLPVQIIHSQSHQLFEAGPTFRRKYLDWGLFYQTQSFLLLWRQFQRVLQHRNTILRQKLSKRELDVWTEEFVKYSLELDHLRKQYLQELIPLITTFTKELLPFSDFNMTYQAGWDETNSLASVLETQRSEEYKLGFTAYGPHRADLHCFIQSQSVKHVLSRGQQKLMICAMMIAQGVLFTKHMKKRLIYLIDDLPSELDSMSSQKLISLLKRQSAQVFITTIDSQFLLDLPQISPQESLESKLEAVALNNRKNDHNNKQHSAAMDINFHNVFHVEQGKIEEVDQK